MISWGTILGGAALTVLFSAVLLVVLREHRVPVIAASLASALAGPMAWNAILHRVHGAEFFVDIPFKPFPISWQDTGSGVFTLAVASVVIGSAMYREPAGRVLRLSAALGLVALLVDIYLY
ncbi:MAG: hypothetical protein PVSMB8_16930 [Vulcanimicrobiaceae bacterium]